MKTVEIIQNETKLFLIPLAGVLYVTKEEITSKATANIILVFSGGQSLKISFPAEYATVVYAEIKSVLSGEIQ